LGSSQELLVSLILIPKAKSFVVASALLDKTLTAEEAIRLAQLEEDFQIERFLDANRIFEVGCIALLQC